MTSGRGTGRSQNIFDKATFSVADINKWEKHLEKLEENQLQT